MVTYVSETESDSADELIDVVDHRNIKKETEIIVEKPQAKTIISAKEKIAVPVTRQVQREVEEVVNTANRVCDTLANLQASAAGAMKYLTSWR